MLPSPSWLSRLTSVRRSMVHQYICILIYFHCSINPTSTTTATTAVVTTTLLAARAQKLSSEDALKTSILVSFLVGALVLCVHSMPDWTETRKFRYRTYDETMQYFNDLNKAFPHLVETYVAQDIWPHILSNEDKNWATCGDKVCQTLVVRITTESMLTNTSPEVYFSGALHGDEATGCVVDSLLFFCGVLLGEEKQSATSNNQLLY